MLPPSELPRLAQIARLAGAEIERFRAAGFGSRQKEDGSIVTEADSAAEAIILDGLQTMAPGIPVIAEEEAAEGVDPICKDCFFLVDPLDGTRDFVESDAGEYAVNIAYVEAGRPLMGVIYGPAHDVMFAGGPDGAWCEIRGQRSQLHALDPAVGALRAVTSRRAWSHKLDHFLKVAAPGGRVIGSSSLKFTRLAAGEAELYPRFSPVSEWDVAAGEAILRAVGGGVMGMDGRPLRYGRRQARYEVDAFVAYANEAARNAALSALRG